jgi:hypothetical protein
MELAVWRSIGTLVLVGALTGVLFTGCENIVGSGSDGDDGPTIETISWEDDGNGYVQYKTNDEDKTGALLQVTYTTSSDSVTSASSVEVETKKLSGAASGFYGVVFGRQDNGNQYVLWIDYDTSRRGFVLGKFHDGEYSSVTTYQEASAIHNDDADSIWIHITRGPYDDSDEHDYDGITIAFKSGNESSYTTETRVHSDALPLGAKGFSAEIASSEAEDFPDTPVDVRFKMISPLAIP